MDWIIGFIALYIFATRDYRQYSAIPDLHILEFTVAYAVAFSDFTKLTLATDLSQYHYRFKSHMKSS
jgi:hypothetical protein